MIFDRFKTLSSNNTWAKDCDKYFYITYIPEEYLNGSDYDQTKAIEIQRPFPLLQPPGHTLQNDHKLTDKVQYGFKHVYKHYADYEWYMKCDDDSYVFVDNLKKFLRGKNSSELVSYGYNIPGQPYQSGGSYVVGNRGMKLLGQALETDTPVKCPYSGFEDVDIGMCMRSLGIGFGRSKDETGKERFCPWMFYQLLNHNTTVVNGQNVSTFCI